MFPLFGIGVLKPSLRSGRWKVVIGACVATIGLLPCVVADHADLVRLSPSNVVESDIWLRSHRDTTDIRRFRVVADWLPVKSPLIRISCSAPVATDVRHLALFDLQMPEKACLSV